MQRVIPLLNGQYYHVFTKSIGGLTIFKTCQEYKRMIHLLRFYQLKNIDIKYSNFLRIKEVRNKGFDYCFRSYALNQQKQVEILAYCLMPNHIHLLLKQVTDQGISNFIGNILNSYTRYFNRKHNRKGPLWIGKFKNVLIERDNQLLHLSRYIHLNPTTSNFVKKPEDWKFSSYCEYLRKLEKHNSICSYQDVIDLAPKDYKKFVQDRIAYQRELAEIKYLLFE